MSDYHISPGLWDLFGTSPGRIGVVCHELGHMFGLPDLYDTSGGGEGLGNWCLMATGSWGFDGSQQYPSHMSAWCKQHLDWLDPTVISSDPGVVQSLQHLEAFPEAFRIDSGYPTGEHLLLENRQAAGFDAMLPGDGLLIYHVDETQGTLGANDVNADEGYPGQAGWPANGNHYRLALLQADGNYDLERGINRGDAGDLYGSSGVDEIRPTTTPDTQAYQGGVLVPNGNAIHSISSVGMAVQLEYESPFAPRIGIGALPPGVAGKPYELQISGSGGTPPVEFRQANFAATYAEVDLGSSRYTHQGVPMGWQADEQVYLLPLLFPFPYFGEEYTEVYVSTNGFLDFAPTEPDPWNDSQYLRFARRIAPLWMDLTTSGPGLDICVNSTPTGIVIVWNAWDVATSLPVNFSVLLDDRGDIFFNYGLGNISLNPTVGIGGGQEGLEFIVSYDGRSNLQRANSMHLDRTRTSLPHGLSMDSNGRITGTPVVRPPIRSKCASPMGSTARISSGSTSPSVSRRQRTCCPPTPPLRGSETRSRFGTAAAGRGTRGSSSSRP